MIDVAGFYATRMRAENEALHDDLEAVAVALLAHGTIGGNTGWRCTMCRGVGEEKSNIKHYDPCPLARPRVQALLLKSQGRCATHPTRR